MRLLADPEWRAEAARALASACRLEAEQVLRLKALVGDGEPAVIAECLGALLHLGRGEALDLVTGFLDHSRPVAAQAAALVLGDSRLEGAVDALTAVYGACADPQLRRTLLLGLAMNRRQPAFDCLMQLLENARAGAQPRRFRRSSSTATTRCWSNASRRSSASVATPSWW